MIGVYQGDNFPGVISANIANGGCLTFVFTSDSSVVRSGWRADISCELPPSCVFPTSLTLDDVTDSTATLYWFENNNPPASEWEIEYGISGFTQGSGTFITVNSNLSTIAGLFSETEYDVYVRAVCDVNDKSSWSLVLPFTTDSEPVIPPVCGGIFVDTGNTIANYQPSENYTITIFPDNVGEYVNVTFTSFNVELAWDGLMVYNGANTSSPLFDSGSAYNRATCPNGAWTGTGDFAATSFTSTDSSGALTFVFTSDNLIEKSGWEANVTCSILGVSEISFNSIIVYPNPAKDLITVALKDFQTDVIIKIYTIQGQEVNKELGVNGTTDIDISNLSSGVYFINIIDNKKIFTKKFIKE